MESKLVIIGNGFDLAHAIKTEYKDFKNYLEKSEFNDQKTQFYQRIIEYLDGDLLWSVFEQALAELDEDSLIDDNSCYLIGYGSDEWRDSANHDYSFMIGESLSFSSQIPYYFSEWIRSIDISVVCTKKTLKNIVTKDCQFISFNYTDILEKVYLIPEANILYVHGKANHNDNLIIGHGDTNKFRQKPEPEKLSEEDYEYLSGIDPRIQEGEEIIRSYFQKTYKDTGNIIKKNQYFFDSLFSINEIYILGHSLSDIDFNYFYEIKKHVNSSCKWNISYHCESDKERIRQFANKLGIGYTFFKF